jgi:hypothetical protein
MGTATLAAVVPVSSGRRSRSRSEAGVYPHPFHCSCGYEGSPSKHIITIDFVPANMNMLWLFLFICQCQTFGGVLG